MFSTTSKLKGLVLILDKKLGSVTDSFFWQLEESIKIQMDKTNVKFFFMMLDLEMKKQQNDFA